MEGTLWENLIILLFWGAVIILLILGKIKIFTSLSILIFACYSFIISLVLIYKVPEQIKERIKQGPDIPYFPLVIGAVIFCLAILCLFIDKLSTRSPNHPPRFRWLWLIFGEVILIAGLTLAIAAIYKSNVFGYERVPLPGLACIFWLSFITIACFIFYKASRMNSAAYPNLMRYVVFLFTYPTPVYTLVLSFILIYSIPTKISYLFWSAIITLGFLPPMPGNAGDSQGPSPVAHFGTI